jgi:hypothetical protein
MDEIDPPIFMDDPANQASKAYILSFPSTMAPDDFPQVRQLLDKHNTASGLFKFPGISIRSCSVVYAPI